MWSVELRLVRILLLSAVVSFVLAYLDAEEGATAYVEPLLVQNRIEPQA